MWGGWFDLGYFAHLHAWEWNAIWKNWRWITVVDFSVSSGDALIESFGALGIQRNLIDTPVLANLDVKEIWFV